MPRVSALGALLALAALCLPSGSEAGGEGRTKPQREGWGVLDPITAWREREVARQVRIEQRVVVRVSPHVMSNRQELASQALEREIANRYQEKRIGKCIPLEGIAGVQTGGGNRIVLFLRDARMISVSLAKSCRSRDFYSGFYVERHQDGRLCTERDLLQARTGAKCEIERLRQLIAIEN
ncbi:MAG: hypothetical protein ACK4IS_02030 [Erythrobacter sp.]